MLLALLFNILLHVVSPGTSRKYMEMMDSQTLHTFAIKKKEKKNYTHFCCVKLFSCYLPSHKKKKKKIFFILILIIVRTEGKVQIPTSQFF